MHFSSDPQTLWVTVANIVLGAVVVICALVVAVGVAHDLLARWRKRVALSHEIDRDLKDLVASFGDAHTMDVPGLGLTMADGGEPEPDPNGKDWK